MKNTNVEKRGTNVKEFEFFDENIKSNVEVVVVYDNRKFYIVISDGRKTEIKEYAYLEDLIRDFIKSENKQMLYRIKIKELKAEIDELYK